MTSLNPNSDVTSEQPSPTPDTPEEAVPLKDLVIVHIPNDKPLEFPENFPQPLKSLALGYELSKDVQSIILTESDESCIVRRSKPIEGIHSCESITSLISSMEAILGYRFNNFTILDEALTHCSIPHKTSNQRFEFLGDAVLDFSVVSLLQQSQPWAKQGDLSAQKSYSTCNRNLGIDKLPFVLIDNCKDVMERQ